MFYCFTINVSLAFQITNGDFFPAAAIEEAAKTSKKKIRKVYNIEKEAGVLKSKNQSDSITYDHQLQILENKGQTIVESYVQDDFFGFNKVNSETVFPDFDLENIYKTNGIYEKISKNSIHLDSKSLNVGVQKLNRNKRKYLLLRDDRYPELGKKLTELKHLNFWERTEWGIGVQFSKQYFKPNGYSLFTGFRIDRNLTIGTGFKTDQRNSNLKINPYLYSNLAIMKKVFWVHELLLENRYLTGQLTDNKKNIFYSTGVGAEWKVMSKVLIRSFIIYSFDQSDRSFHSIFNSLNLNLNLVLQPSDRKVNKHYD